MRRLSVAVQNTIPKKLRERIDVPAILVISDSSTSDPEENYNEFGGFQHRIKKTGSPQRRVSESDATSGFKPLFSGEWCVIVIWVPFVWLYLVKMHHALGKHELETDGERF